MAQRITTVEHIEPVEIEYSGEAVFVAVGVAAGFATGMGIAMMAPLLSPITFAMAKAAGVNLALAGPIFLSGLVGGVVLMLRLRSINLNATGARMILEFADPLPPPPMDAEDPVTLYDFRNASSARVTSVLTPSVYKLLAKMAWIDGKDRVSGRGLQAAGIVTDRNNAEQVGKIVEGLVNLGNWVKDGRLTDKAKLRLFHFLPDELKNQERIREWQQLAEDAGEEVTMTMRNGRMAIVHEGEHGYEDS